MKIILLLLIILSGPAVAGSLSSNTYRVVSTDSRIYPQNLAENVLGIPLTIPNPGLFYRAVALCNLGDKVLSGGFYALGTLVLGTEPHTATDGREGWALSTTPLQRLPNLYPPPPTLPNVVAYAVCTGVIP